MDCQHSLICDRGGLGLTSCIADAGSLIDCLYGILDGKADLDKLEKYDEDRRRVYETQTNPVSTGNLERMMKGVEFVVANDPFITNVAKKNEPFLRMLHDEELKMSSDMTKYYTK
jgi:2-polyprenyl-6-methoxyphenol hydroxylase-like FAD-dependent oxidoreductase